MAELGALRAPPQPAAGLGLLDRIRERLPRSALGDLSNAGQETFPLRRLREATEAAPEASADEKVTVQKFDLISRGAPPAKRPKVRHEVLVAPPRVAAQLGKQIDVCRCSDCDRSGVRRRASTGRRKCRRDTEAHPEYALLLMMSEKFEEECPARSGARQLVTEACCREKTAFFIMGPDLTTVGYVAAELAPNRRARVATDTVCLEAALSNQEQKTPPLILQIYVEPDYRCRGYASQALDLLTQRYSTLDLDDPPRAVLNIFEHLGFGPVATREGPHGRPIVTLTKDESITDL